MDSRPQFLAQLRRMLAATCPPERLRIAGVETFDGATPRSELPSAAIALEAEPAPRELVERAARIAASSLSDLVGLELRWGVEESHNQVHCWLESLDAALALQALAFALLATVKEEPHPSGPLTDRLAKTTRWRSNPESLLLIKAARVRGIPFLPLADDASLWQFGWGSRSKLFWEMASNDDGMVAFKLSRSKDAAKRLMRDLGIPTPRWRTVGPDQDPAAAAIAIGLPCVVKPLDRGGGKGVTANIESLAEVGQAAALARRFAKVILIEAHQPGDDHRLTLIRGRLIEVTRRRPAEITGDGRSTIAELVSALNASRRSSVGSAGYLKPVPQDAAMDAALRKQGVVQETILAAGKRIQLRTNANQSTGGTVDNLTDRIHPSVKALAEQMALAFGLSTCGIDYITADIGRSPEEGGGAFIEINATPGVRGMIAAGFDEAEVAWLALGDTLGRIPVRLFLAPEAELPALEERLAEAHGDDDGAGLATLERGTLGALSVPAPMGNPLRLVRALLRYRSLDRLDIVWSVEALLRQGLPVDRLDALVTLGAAPPEPWLRLLQRVSGSLTQAATLDEALAASSS